MTANEILAEHRLRAVIDDEGVLVVSTFDGHDCTYSGRIFAPVVLPNLSIPVAARLVKIGVGEIELNGRVLTVRQEEPPPVD